MAKTSKRVDDSGYYTNESGAQGGSSEEEILAEQKWFLEAGGSQIGDPRGTNFATGRQRQAVPRFPARGPRQ